MHKLVKEQTLLKQISHWKNHRSAQLIISDWKRECEPGSRTIVLCAVNLMRQTKISSNKKGNMLHCAINQNSTLTRTQKLARSPICRNSRKQGRQNGYDRRRICETPGNTPTHVSKLCTPAVKTCMQCCQYKNLLNWCLQLLRRCQPPTHHPRHRATTTLCSCRTGNVRVGSPNKNASTYHKARWR